MASNDNLLGKSRLHQTVRFSVTCTTDVIFILRYCSPPESGRSCAPLTRSSSRVKPRPVRTLVLYLKVGQRTAGRSRPATGRGRTRRARATRAARRRTARAGWLNQHFTNRCQSLWKWAFGIILLRFGAMALQRQRLDYVVFINSTNNTATDY